jgi:GAF domain-containing protein
MCADVPQQSKGRVGSSASATLRAVPETRGDAAQLTDVLRATTRAVRRHYGAAGASVALTTPDEMSLRFVAADGGAGDAIVGMELPLEKGIAGWVAVSQAPMAVADVQHDPRFARDVAEAVGYVPSSILAAPLPGPDVAYGVIEVLDPDPTRRGDLGTLSLAGSLLAALVAQTWQTRIDDALTHQLVRVTSLGPSAVALANRLLDAVVETWDSGE